MTNGNPSTTYVRRDDQEEGELASHLVARQKIVAISGPSKAGKSVLANRVIREALGWDIIDVSGNDLATIDDFWLTLAAHAGLSNVLDVTVQSGLEVKAEVSGETGIPSLAKLQGHASSGISRMDSTHTGVTIDLRRAVREHLSGMQAVVVIDDFHYAPEKVRVQVARALKELSFRGVPTVLIAVPYRVFDAVLSEQELLGRIVRKKVPHWEPMELARIAYLGFNAMNAADPAGRISSQLVNQSFGSPLLMQELSREICRRNGVLETEERTIPLQEPRSWNDFFADVAANFEHPLAYSLLAGPQERKRRKQRPLRRLDVEVDSYGAVLLGLRDRLPQISSTLTELTDAVNLNLQQRMQLQEVQRVCHEMWKRAEKNRRGGDAAIDFSMALKRLTIADPYLAFYVAWGLQSIGLPDRGL